MSLSLTQSAVSLIQTAGYGGLTLGLILDSAGIPIPSEVLIPLSTVAARQGRFNLFLVMLIGTVAQFIGGVIAYEIGRWAGFPLLERYGRYILISPRDLTFTHRQFERYGGRLALVGRCLPVIRGYVGFVAGIARMPRPRFWLATLIGSLLWTLLLMLAGWLLAADVTVIDRALKPISYLVIIVILLFAGWWLLRRFRERRPA